MDFKGAKVDVLFEKSWVGIVMISDIVSISKMYERRIYSHN